MDLGGTIEDPKLIGKVRAVLERREWVFLKKPFADVPDSFVENAAGVWRKGDTLIYLPRSGVAVVRYKREIGESSEGLSRDPVDDLVELIRWRAEAHSQIYKDGFMADYPEIVELGESLRKVVARGSGFAKRLSHLDSPRIHIYSLSYFELSPSIPKSTLSKLVYACLNPREVGCSGSIAKKDWPIKAVMRDRVVGFTADDVVECHVVSTPDASVYASWSSVVSQSRGSRHSLDVISAIEFRVQSTWLMAYNLGNSTWVKKGAGVYRSTSEIEFLRAEYSMMKVETLKRIGANSPEFETSVYNAVVRTSELEDELEKADKALEVAGFSAAVWERRKQRWSRITLELLALLFAASGFAELLFELPVTLEVVKSNVYAFTVWLLGTLVFACVILVKNWR